MSKQSSNGNVKLLTLAEVKLQELWIGLFNGCICMYLFIAIVNCVSGNHRFSIMIYTCMQMHLNRSVAILAQVKA